MKSLGNMLFAATGGNSPAQPHRAFERVSAPEMALPESWFRDAILFRAVVAGGRLGSALGSIDHVVGADS